MAVEVPSPNGRSASPASAVNSGAPEAGTTNGAEPAKPKFIVGMIYPPPDIRTIVDSTAGFVAVSANPIQFEEKIRENHRQDPKFSFLNPADPYHAYYRHRIERTREGDVDGADRSVVPTPAAETARPDGPLSTAPKEPPTLPFVVEVPHKSALDLDILKLTALFTARRGPTFLRSLSVREGRNYQFDFLRPDHSLFSYFNRIVEQYSRVLYPPPEDIEKIESFKTPEGRDRFLKDAKARGEWQRYETEREAKRAKERDEEAIAFAEIDWHDFAIVQTIEFTQADAQSELPAPMTILEMEELTEKQKRVAAMITEDTAPEVEAHKASQAAADAAAAASQSAVSSVNGVKNGMDAVDDDDEEQKQVLAMQEAEQLSKAKELQARSVESGAPMKIRTDYIPKSIKERNAKAAVTTCTICGQQIPVNELDEHMRIELLDPRWKSQRDTLEARKAQASELQRGADVGSALKQLARARGDLFDGDDEKRRQQEEEERLRRKEREKAVWDGHTASKESTLNKYQAHVNFDEQIAAIHKAHGLGQADVSTIGPTIGPNINPIPTTSTLPPPPLSLPQNPNTLAASHPNAVITAEPQPASATSYAPTQLPLPPGGAAAGMHPSRLAALGGNLSGRPADGAPEGEPIAKRPRIERIEGHYYPEEDWINMHPEAITLSVQLPNYSEKSEWNLNGAVITIPDIPLTLLVSSLRDRIIANVKANIPASRIRLSFRNKMLTNANTLASYNMDDDDLVVMTLKEARK
ncbi:Pre-mRNA splicing factor PRP21 like protein-domain-containing protein [Cantharellus anzutake]|uniref:Pre-mRNA splicing factor PRP21 like protein-domain-containing protein n=1 Tax=Cantharellus anzutake TaxID=1750568 RepID=UPI001906664C|nr:Pre-mRNA splicing factor PRP21 like protein-domain-containing protein [Cantharellus anzutake]KAF8333989.1 Pre-mRNA splicing factor PRP21 like protein-domain-containing protein [Cantharellus anzutake]